MFQQIIALIIILYFIFRLIIQKKKNHISRNEFVFWLIFWLLSATAIVGLKWIDALVAQIGFSGSGIEVLFYLAVIIIFYLIFRIRLKIEKIESNITKIIRNQAINKNQDTTNKIND